MAVKTLIRPSPFLRFQVRSRKTALLIDPAENSHLLLSNGMTEP
jgi:hypothetical protein